MEGHLKGLLIDTPKDSIMDGIIESVLVKEKLDEIYKALQNVVDGEIIEKWERMNIQSLTENTLTDLQLFLQDIGLTRQRGYALDREENEYHVFCVGAVVMDFSNRPIGAISISGSTLTPQEEKEVSSMLLSPSRKLSGLLGYAVR